MSGSRDGNTDGGESENGESSANSTHGHSFQRWTLLTTRSGRSGDAEKCRTWTGVRQSLRPHLFQVTALDDPSEEHPMSKRARKRRTRKGSKANHGRRPNA